LDLQVGIDHMTTEDKYIVSILETAVTTYPDVRVFNLSFSDHIPLTAHSATDRAERLRTIQDLDNFVFARDVVVVVAAGNSNAGQRPNTDYPENHQDTAWGLGHWATAFNALTVGSFVRNPQPDGLAGHAQAPSPFCKVGPGIAGMHGPDLSSNGGDVDATYNARRGIGVGCLSPERPRSRSPHLGRRAMRTLVSSRRL